MVVLDTVGLEPYEDFPTAPYEEVHSIIKTKLSGHAFYSEYAGAWNAVAYRFHSMVDAGEGFRHSLDRYGAHPPPAQRFEQEKLLSEFYGAGFATFESAFYGLFAIAAMVAESPLSLATARDKQRVSPGRTEEALRSAFPDDPILAPTAQILSDNDFKTFRETRNILTHRTAPGRLMYVGIGTAEQLPTEWKLNNVPLDETIATGGRAQVSRLLTDIVAATADFTRRRI